MYQIIKVVGLVIGVPMVLYITSQHGLVGGTVTGTVLAVVGLLLSPFLKGIDEGHERRKRLEFFAEAIGHHYIFSTGEGDQTVKEQAEETVSLLKESGNLEFASGHVKVYAMYYQESLTHDEVISIEDGDDTIDSYLVVCDGFERFLEVCGVFRDQKETEYQIKMARHKGEWFRDVSLRQDREKYRQKITDEQAQKEAETQSA